MSLIQLIYASRPFGFDNATLNVEEESVYVRHHKHSAKDLASLTASSCCQLFSGPWRLS